MAIIDQLTNHNNFNKYGLEVVSWENDGDHYGSNVFFFQTKEELLKAIELGEVMCKYRHGRVGYKGEVYENTASFLTTLRNTDYLAHQLAIDLVGGYEYECDLVRQGESLHPFHVSITGQISPL